ncbi:hypothetical protein GR927_40570 [Mycolicibacterium sp. 3033]|nr:hypothetical protein [Mycolicibacterium aurantiacum]
MSPRTWRRAAGTALAGAVLVGGLAAGLSAPVAAADPAAAPSTGDAPPPVSPDRILMMINEQYNTGSGGGQVSKLIDQVMTLRMQGFRPSRANTTALADALDKRPNQAPLVEALQATLMTQRKMKMQASNQVQQPAVAPPATPGIVQAPMGPSWGPGNPMIQDPSDTIFPMPGRTG